MALKYLHDMRRFLMRNKGKYYTMYELRNKLNQNHVQVKENLTYLSRFEKDVK